MSDDVQVALPRFTALELRVLGVLVEKELTVPDSYPLTLNALVAGCNQKSSRDPVMSATEAQVKDALDDLRRRSLILETSGGRAWRYAHNVPKALALGSAETALLTALWLRGPQTPGELRIAAERFYRFADLSSVEAYLEDLATRTPAKVVRLPRQPGAREARWAHLYGDPPAIDPALPEAPGPRPSAMDDDVLERMLALEERVARLEEAVGRFKPE